MNQKPSRTFFFSLIDITNLLFLAALFIFLILTGNRTPYFIFLIVLYTLFFFITWLMARWRQNVMGDKRINSVLFFYPVVLFLCMYESLSVLLPYFNDRRYDTFIEALDNMFLGVSPTIWLQQYTAPWLTELMYLFYFIYFPLPLILIIDLLRKQQFRATEKIIFTLFICYYSAYICYFIVPVMGPRYFLASQYSIPLDGLMFSEPIRVLVNFGEPSQLDCFPSLHAAILLVTLMLAFRFQRKMFYYIFPPGVGIMISLIYLRYHYFTDVVAGAVWAVASIALSRWLFSKLHPHFSFHFR